MTRIAIIGGGISGLAAAFELEQRRRHDKRFSAEPETTFPMSDGDLRSFRDQFEAPDEAELLSSEVGPPLLGHATWIVWISERWPTSIP